MGNFLSNESHSEESTPKNVFYPNPHNKKLDQQSVVKEGGDWGKDAHRVTTWVDGKATFGDLISEYPGRNTAYENFQTSVKEFGDNNWIGTRTVLADGAPGPYEFLTYSEGAAQAEQIGSGLVKLGIEPQESFGIYSKNRAEWVISEQACNCYSIPTVAIYDTLGADAIHYVMEHSDMKGLFFESKQLESVLSALNKGLPLVKIAVCFDDVTEETKISFKEVGVALYSFKELMELGKDNIQAHTPPKKDDVAILMYTSGTTGNPKGVVITHNSMMSELKSLRQVAELNSNDIHFSFLPLAHIFERLVQVYCVEYGCSIGFFRGIITELLVDVQTLRPTFFIAVPRVLTRIYDKITQNVKTAGGLKEVLFNSAYAARLAALKNGQDTPVYNKLIFNKVKMALGGRVRFMITGSAPLDTAVHDFLRVCLCPSIIVGYGLTETTAGTCITRADDIKLGHVGPPLGVCEIKLVDIPDMNYLTTDELPRGEVCVRGYNIFQSYFKNPEKTKEEVDEDGWFHTGDVGCWNPNGTLSIIDRKKSIFKLSQGEYLAAEALEQQYGKAEHIAQIFVTGNSYYPYPVAVVVPDPEVVAVWAKSKGIAGDHKAICESEKLKELLITELMAVHKSSGLKGFEKLKDFIVEPECFCIDNDLLTPTFKLKRVNATKKYKEVLDELYLKIEASLKK